MKGAELIFMLSPTINFLIKVGDKVLLVLMSLFAHDKFYQDDFWK